MQVDKTLGPLELFNELRSIEVRFWAAKDAGRNIIDEIPDAELYEICDLKNGHPGEAIQEAAQHAWNVLQGGTERPANLPRPATPEI